MDNESRIKEILNALITNGTNIIETHDVYIINSICLEYLNGNYSNLNTVNDILQISNILYNNTTDTVLPLEDGVYDLVVAKYDKETNGGAPVGAPPIKIKVKNSIIGSPEVITTNDTKLEVIGFVDADKMTYFKNIIANSFPNPLDFVVSNHEPIVNNQDKIQHNYPELVGTLYKCKFVLRDDAVNNGVAEDDPSVLMFDRDFMGLYYGIAEQICYQKGIPVELVAELKYDGISVEATVQGDTIISACSRGDTANDVATDLTPIFGGYKFHRAAHISKEYIFGIKFECIITKTNLRRLQEDHGITYKNARVAVIGLTGRLDAINFRDYLTLVPIKASGIYFNDTLMELTFLNENYSTGEYMRFAIMRGNYNQLLQQVKRFTDEAEYMREAMDFLYDGVVISFTDPDVRRQLGRVNDKDIWSIAIKFNASAKTAYFQGYTFTVGQDGRITPMAHFTPVEFMGTIHNQQTVHSFKRFNELELHVGDIILVTYVHDVICYITKPDNSYNRTRENQVPLAEFPTHCPFCGTELVYSDSGNSCFCPNIHCPERVLVRLTNTLKKLGIKDFGKALLSKLNIHSLTELLNMTFEKANAVLGEQTSLNLMDRIDQIKTTRWKDYRLFGAIGFTGISDVRWKTILEIIPYKSLITMDSEDLKVALNNIKGIGESMIQTIVNERPLFIEDLNTFMLLNVEPSYGAKPVGPGVRFSGVRNEALMDAFNEAGFDANGDKDVVKNTRILIVPYYGYNSNKVVKATKYNCLILTEADAWSGLQSGKLRPF